MSITEGQDLTTYDVVVVGGGAAGLSGALTLGRARRSVLVVDAGEPRNAPASGVHGFLTRDGTNPAALLRAGRAEVRRYGAQVLDGRVASAAPLDGGFAVGLEDGRRVGARRLLVTTGLVDELPDVPGVRERWGRDVLHCPYCHGWEVRDQPIGVLALNSWAAHQALLFRQWSADVTLFLHAAPRPTDEEAEKLAVRGIAVVEGEVASLEIVEDRLAGVQMRSGEVVACRAVALMPRFVARAEMFKGLGLEATVHPLGVGEHIDADATGLTAVPGVWVAGNVADLMAQVVGAAEAGVRAGAAINADLIAEDTDRAVTAYRAQRKTQTFDQREPSSAEAESEVCERVLGDRRHGP
jgi:thioredoxin reductase